MTAGALPTVTFADSEDALLSYLAERTSETVGLRVDRADSVLLGRVDEVSLDKSEVERAQIEAMRPWLSGEVGPPSVRIAVAEVVVERSLAAGANDGERVQVARPFPASPPAVPLTEAPDLVVGDSGLFFLRRPRGDAPYGRYLPERAYELADAHGLEPRKRTDYDAKGDPIEVDRSSIVEAMTAAVEWYRSLGSDGAQDLAASIDHPNRWIRRHATRALALEGTEQARAALSRAEREALPDDQRDRLMIGLWLAGLRDEARARLRENFRSVGKEAWLSGWAIDVEPSADVSARLRGPDPTYQRGD